jgi:hypothetical protein
LQELQFTINMAELTIGSVIALTDGRQATVRFIGATSFADGEWIGVELTDDTGKNDGSVQGERYFDCEPGFGMFVRPTAVASVIERPVRTAKPAAKQPAGTAPSQSRSRAQSGISGAPGLKRPGSISSMNPKRNSASSSPTPASKGPAQRLSLKVSFRSRFVSASLIPFHADAFKIAYKTVDVRNACQPTFYQRHFTTLCSRTKISAYYHEALHGPSYTIYHISNRSYILVGTRKQDKPTEFTGVCGNDILRLVQAADPATNTYD